MVLVRWKGYTSADDSWEPVTYLNDELKKDVAVLREKYFEKTGRKKRHYHWTRNKCEMNDDTWTDNIFLLIVISAKTCKQNKHK